MVPVLVEMRTPRALSSASRPFRAVKPTVATVELAGVSELIVITEIVPSGSTVYSSFGSPSLATTSFVPSGVKAIESGTMPTATEPAAVTVAALPTPVTLKKKTLPSV